MPLLHFTSTAPADFPLAITNARTSHYWSTARTARVCPYPRALLEKILADPNIGHRERHFLDPLVTRGLDTPELRRLALEGSPADAAKLEAILVEALRVQARRKEDAFERVRAERFAALPSRRWCLFAYDTEPDEADDLARSMGIDIAEKYLLELEGERRTSVDAGWLDRVPGLTLEERAAAYWSGRVAPKPKPETLIGGSVRIVRIVRHALVG